MPGLHICRIEPRGSDSRGEWVAVANDAETSQPLRDLKITDYTLQQQHVHVYRFPGAQGGAQLHLGPRETAYVFTSAGTNASIMHNGRRQLLLFAGRAVAVWNNAGEVAYLRRADGTFVDSMTVGDPARHPRGH